MSEVKAIESCLEAIEPLDEKARKRVASYLTSWANDSEKPKAVGFAAASPSPEKPE
ncbi:hypothetical protein [Botrimarina mediterranea]|uniref:hypothetical protein n=1 Tax=Botrimarina mediterranea TaxID=2528022 RepID=UPI00118A04CE|nr:hypothetical protein K2D_16520 [Planctomycetes bacterium K2D]